MFKLSRGISSRDHSLILSVTMLASLDLMTNSPHDQNRHREDTDKADYFGAAF